MIRMRRRDFMRLSGAAAFVAASLGAVRHFGAAAEEEVGGEPFDASTVRQIARRLAAQEYQPPDRSLPPELDTLSYDDYRNIRFRPERALWRDEDGNAPPLAFQVQLFARGFLFRDRVDVYLVQAGRSQRLAYAPDLFRFDNGVKPPDPKLDLGFSGFRLHAPINDPQVFDEVAAFQGASYFRGVGQHQNYGSSARGLAIATADPAGEEFPVFKAFWIEKPQEGARTIVVHALLDSPSTAAAFRFSILPGDTTTMAVETAIYPRKDLDKLGLAPLTSMFLFGPNDRAGVDDFREAVRDAEGLAIVNGSGEQLWRPLVNPERLQVSVFVDAGTRGFGLMQRQRSFFDYQDLEARYERRPSVWVEPIGDWGAGAVYLVEIPTPEEVHDNIVAFWRPREPLRKGGEYSYTYRLHWGWGSPVAKPDLTFGATRIGGDASRRQFVIDVVGEPGDGELRAEVTTSAGSVRDVSLFSNPEIKGRRLAFTLDVTDVAVAELRARVMRGTSRVSEVWIYRWTP